MSLYTRAHARTIFQNTFGQQRLYGSKVLIKPRAEDASKLWEQLSELDLKDPKQLFDDEIVSQASASEADEDDHSHNLPVSPIMDAKTWKRRFKPEPKLSKPHPSEMTERELRLMKNPYANTLATSTRLEAFFGRSLPKYFLQRFKIFVNPETKEPWILPFGNRSRDDQKIVPGTSKYVGNNIATIDSLKSRRWKKMLDNKFVISGVWRSDAADFVHHQLQARVYEEVANCQRWIMSANKEGGKWEYMDIGCLLVWENKPGSIVKAADFEASIVERDNERAVEESDGGHTTSLEDLKPQEQIETEKEVKEELKERLPRILVRVKDKLIPRYDMVALLGPEKAMELKEQLKIENVVRQNVLLVSARTTKTQMWLWKLAGYTRKQGISLFDNI